MKKEYVRPELTILSLEVEDNTNAFDIKKDDSVLSIGDDFWGSLFG